MFYHLKKKNSIQTNATSTKINPRWNDKILYITDECLFENRKSILERHNFYRSLHGLRPLTTDPDLEKSAHEYAKVLGSRNHSNEWEHKDPNSDR